MEYNKSPDFIKAIRFFILWPEFVKKKKKSYSFNATMNNKYNLFKFKTLQVYRSLILKVSTALLHAISQLGVLQRGHQECGFLRRLLRG